MRHFVSPQSPIVYAPPVDARRGARAAPATERAAAQPAWLNAPGDAHERQADEVASRVMRTGAPAVQRCACGGGCPACRRSSAGAGVPEAATSSAVPAVVHDAVQSPGQALEPGARRFMESRMGQDLGHVRVHTDDRAARSARALNAEAYTVGRDIVFGAGRYDPHSAGGRHLLAHELAHVQQQGERPAVQRKIAVGDAMVDLSSYFNGFGVTGYTRTGNVYSHAGATGDNIWSEILLRMLSSGRTFYVDGSTSVEAQGNLDDHVESRKGIIDFAAKKKYTFGAGSAMTMNPAFWEKKGGRWQPKAGVSRADAINDLNVNPKLYSIACLMATRLTMEGGSGSPLTRDTGVADTDWVPGDWGYIKNTNFTNDPKDIGLEGENLINVGFGQFWGHFTGTNTYRTLDEWFKEVEKWHGGASILTHRDRPSKGLL